MLKKLPDPFDEFAPLTKSMFDYDGRISPPQPVSDRPQILYINNFSMNVPSVSDKRKREDVESEGVESEDFEREDVEREDAEREDMSWIFKTVPQGFMFACRGGPQGQKRAYNSDRVKVNSDIVVDFSVPYSRPRPDIVDGVGVYSKAQRATRLKRWKMKRQSLSYQNRTKYGCRKETADKRLRHKGRFVKKGDSELLLLLDSVS